MSHPRSFDEIVNHQVRRWEMESEQGRPAAPTVALSRLPGSAAAELGQDVADRLGFGFFGIEIVDLIARETGTQRDLVAGLDEHVRSTIERYVVDATKGRTYDENVYHQQLVRTVTTLGERGLSVILGRGSAFLLRPERTLRVLVVAPREDRVERLAKRLDLSTEAASDHLDREDADRLHFNRHHFHVDADDASLYDLVVNTGALSLALAAELVVEAALGRFPQLT
ncbi:MAG: cytidylate kinase-like family protein [bacterium]|nr:cytidylate kinase-like family protein [bacterium]MCP5064973.1 cytidylate kinase-like family protein [bacterium]